MGLVLRGGGEGKGGSDEKEERRKKKEERARPTSYAPIFLEKK